MPIPGKNVSIMLHFGDKQTVANSINTNLKILSINLTHWTIKTPQNVIKMSAVSPDTSRETAYTLYISYYVFMYSIV